MTAAAAQGLGPPPARPAGALLPASCRVLSTRQELPDTWTLELEAPPGFAARPGQFSMLYAFGVGEVPISFSGLPGPTVPEGRLVQTIRAVGSTTRALCALRAGDVVGVRGPFGAPWPVERAHGQDAVFVAGGIGLAPLRPALEAALAARARFGRVVLLVGARTPADLLYREQLEGWARRGDVEVRVTVDAAPVGPGAAWTGDVGFVTALLPRAGLDPARAVAFVCGPEVMMRFVARDLAGLGVDPARVLVSLERNMHCAVGTCGRCQLAGSFVCKDGPVFTWPQVEPLLRVREL